jgi:hypothetical protein
VGSSCNHKEANNEEDRLAVAPDGVRDQPAGTVLHLGLGECEHAPAYTVRPRAVMVPASRVTGRRKLIEICEALATVAGGSTECTAVRRAAWARNVGSIQPVDVASQAVTGAVTVVDPGPTCDMDAPNK